MPLSLETEMPKMKTKSSAKKQIRKLRGTTVLKDCDAKVIKKKYMPYG